MRKKHERELKETEEVTRRHWEQQVRTQAGRERELEELQQLVSQSYQSIKSQNTYESMRAAAKLTNEVEELTKKAALSPSGTNPF